jgi:hypothetical protein
MPTEKRGFEGKMKEVDYVEGGYKGKEKPIPKLPHSTLNCQHQLLISYLKT